MKFLVAFVGLFAVGNAATVLRLADPAVLPTVVSPAVIPSLVPHIPSVLPVADLAEWEAYKTKFGKTYVGLEDRFRSYIYFANKEKLVKYDELVRFGLGSERVELDIFADYTRDELFSLRSILEESQDEWNSYKLKYGKVYDSFEDRFRKTIYFIVKDIYAAQNRLVDHGFASYRLAISIYTDYFRDELPTGTHLYPLSFIVPSTRILSTIPGSYPIPYPLARGYRTYIY